MFEVGRVYNRRDELHGKYGEQQQGGISTPTDHPFIMLFTGESGEQYGYSDGPNDNGVFVYTGEGQKGDMEFVRGNKGIRDHASDGKALQLFKSLGKGRGYEFVGEFVCSTFDYRRGPDVDGNDRRVIVFHLVGIDDQRDGGRNNEESTESIESLRKQAYDAATPATEASERDAKHHVYERMLCVVTSLKGRMGCVNLAVRQRPFDVITAILT